MRHSLIKTALLSIWAQSIAAQKAYTYQTLSDGQVQWATTTLGTSSPSESDQTTSSVPYTYTLDTKVVAYPTYSTVDASIAAAPAASGLPSATDFAALGAQLIFLFKDANSTNCQRCKDVMMQVQESARAEQNFLGRIAEPFCQAVSAFLPFNLCVGLFRIGSNDVGAAFASYGTDIQAQDGQLLCAYMFGLCELPPPPAIDLNALFNGTTKPPPKTLVSSNKEPLKVLHISDYHLDPRYVAGSEANCTGTALASLCCRVYPYTNLSEPIKQPASIFGNYECDTPEPLGTSVFRAIPSVTNTTWSDFAFGIFTGDLVSHDIWELTPDYVVANELLSYQNFFDGFGGVPMYPTLGNHDTYPQAFTAFPAEDIYLSSNAAYDFQQAFNYDNVSTAWQAYGWLNDTEAQDFVSSGLGIYRARTAQGLTIISLNSDAWYYVNYYGYISANDFDPTGMFRVLVNWLLEAEANDEPVWLIQHVNTGGSVTYESLPAASDLFYQVVDRFNNTIRATFFGHTHNDEFGVFYTNNATIQTADTAASVAYIGPSVTTYQNLNAGFRYYLVDPDTFAVIDSINYIANVSDTDAWAAAGDVTWQFSYSARDTYDPDGTLLNDGGTGPLTPAFWHAVADRVRSDDDVFARYADLRNKLFRPVPAVDDALKQVIRCGVASMSVPIFEDCLGSRASLNSLL